MMFCAAVWCCSESGKSQDISFYHLPRDQTLKAKWLQKMKRDSLPSEKNYQSLSRYLMMNASNETWWYIIIYCEDFSRLSLFLILLRPAEYQKGEIFFHEATSATSFSAINRSSPSEVFLEKDVLKICSKFTGEHPCRSAISIKLQRTLFRTLFYKNTYGGLHLNKCSIY